MDHLSKAVLEAGASLAQDRDAARACLRSAAQCQAALTKCTARGGPCESRQRPRIAAARLECRALGVEAYAAATARCEPRCLSEVSGLRGSTVALGGEAAARARAAVAADPQRAATMSTCMLECQQQQALDSKPYSQCIDQALERLVTDCVRDSCRADLLACLSKRCGLN